MSYFPAIHIPVTVDNSNKWIDFVYSSVTYAASIAATTYTNLFSLSSAVDTAIDATSAALTVTHLLYTESGVPGHLQIVGSGDFKILWKTGVHAGSNAHTILGFSNAADSANTDDHVSTYQMPGAWFPMRVPASDSEDRRRHKGGPGRPVLSGAYYKRLTVCRPRYRNVSFEVLEPEVTFAESATSTNLNRDFETVWQTIIGGQSFQYMNDYTTATATTYYLLRPDDLMEIGRPHVDAEYYNLSLEFQRKE